MKLIVIFIGGGCGSVLRYLIGTLLPKSGFPWATLAVNVLGAFAIGLFCVWSERFTWSAETRLALTVGLCGGFTTFSTFSRELVSLLESGRPFPALAYAAASLLLTLGAALLGTRIGKM